MVEDERTRRDGSDRARDGSEPSSRTPPDPASRVSRAGAADLARQIERDIVKLGWPVGEVLGSEVELLERYGVGRAVLREAVRVLESNRVATRRPGPGGGLVVTAPDVGSVLEGARLYLDYAGVRPDHLYETWIALQVIAVDRLCRTIDAEGIEHLRAVVQAEGECLDGPVVSGTGPNFDVEVARLADNPALELFIQVIIELSLAHGVEVIPARAARWLYARHVEIAEAVVAGDAALAQHLVRRYVEALAGMGAITDPTSPPPSP